MKFLKSKSEKIPNVGEQKQGFKYAWWPIKVEDTWIWLEVYSITWEYVTYRQQADYPYDVIIFEWQIIKKQLIYDNDEPRSV